MCDLSNTSILVILGDILKLINENNLKIMVIRI